MSNQILLQNLPTFSTVYSGKSAVWISHCSMEYAATFAAVNWYAARKKLTVVPHYWIKAVCHTTTYNLPLDEVAGNGVYRPHIELSWPRLHHSWIHLRPEILPLFALTVRECIKCNYCDVCLSENGRSPNLLRIRRHLWWKFDCTNAKEWNNGIQNLRVINGAIIC